VHETEKGVTIRKKKKKGGRVKRGDPVCHEKKRLSAGGKKLIPKKQCQTLLKRTTFRGTEYSPIEKKKKEGRKPQKKNLRKGKRRGSYCFIGGAVGQGEACGWKVPSFEKKGPL